MRYGVRELASLLTAVVAVSSFAAAPVSAAGGGVRPAAAAVEAAPVPDKSSKAVDVTVTPPKDITFGQVLGNPSAEQRDTGDGVDSGADFTYRYVGVDGTDYDSEEKPLGAGTYQVIAVLNSATHSGEGTSALFTIRKAPGCTVKRTITVPTVGGTRTVPISELSLYSSMMKGAEIRQAPAIAGGEVLESVTTTSDGAAFILSTKAAPNGKTQSFRFALASDNYQELSVLVAVVVSTAADDLEITGLRVRAPGTFAYGTALRDMVDLEDCAAVVNGQSASGTFSLAEPKKCYGVGESTGITLRFFSGGQEYTKTVPAEFTIRPAEVTFVGWDEAFIRDGYWITTYANSPYNAGAEKLRDLVQDRKETFTVSRGSRRITLDAAWSADEGSPPFEPRGQRPHQAGDIIWYDWYAYTAALSSWRVNVKNLSAGSVQPKAYIRVVPVAAVTEMEGDGLMTVGAADVAALTEEDWKSVLGLPETAAVHYEPVERPAWSDEYVPTPDGVYDITGWQLDGKDFTLAALKARAAGAVSGDVKVSLTPVYADSGENAVPAWATITDTPTFALTITPDKNAQP